MKENTFPLEIETDGFFLYTDAATRSLTSAFDIGRGYSPLYRSDTIQTQSAETYLRRLVGISVHARQVVGVDFHTFREFPTAAGLAIPDQARVFKGIVGLIQGDSMEDEIELFRAFADIRKSQGVEAVRFVEHDRTRIYMPTRALLDYLKVPLKSPASTTPQIPGSLE